jgi:hypothetical protein
LSRHETLSTDRFRSDLARVLDRVAGELAWGAQVCADIEDALSGLFASMPDLPLSSTTRIQRLDELRQTLEDLGRLQQQLAHLAEGRDGVRLAVDSTIRQESLRWRLTSHSPGGGTAATLAAGVPDGASADPAAGPEAAPRAPGGRDETGEVTWL